MNTQLSHLDARVDFSVSNGRSRTDSTVTGVAQPKISSGAKNTRAVRPASLVGRLGVMRKLREVKEKLSV